MADPPEAIVLILDAGASTVAWARDALPPAEVGAALGGAPAAAATSDDGDNGGEGGGAAAAHRRPADPTAGPANPRVFEILRSAAMRLVATRFCYCSKQDRLGLVVMGQPVAGSDDEDEGDSSSDSEEEEADGDTSPGGGGKEGGRDKEVGVVEEDSASLMHPVTKVSFALMQKLRDLPIAGAETIFRDGIVRAGGHMMVMTANTKLKRRILLFTDARAACTSEDQELLIDAVGAMHAEGMRLDVVIPGLAELPDYDDDEDTWAEPEEELNGGEEGGSVGGSAGGSSPPTKGRRMARRNLPEASADDDDGMDVTPAVNSKAGLGSQEGVEDEDEESGTVSNPTMRRAFAPEEVDAEVRARLEHSTATGGAVRKSPAQARNETLLRRAAAVTGGMPLSLSTLIDYLSTPRKRAVRPVAKYSGTLSLSPSVHIPVRAYTATTEVRLPTCKRLSWARTLEAGHPVAATRHTTYATLGNPDEALEEEDILPAYAFGCDIVPVSAEVDATHVRCAGGAKGLRVLGFVPLAAIPQPYFLGAVDAVMAMGEIPESRASLAALATAMQRRKRGAIARLVTRADGAAQLKFLWADELPPGNPSGDDEEEEDDMEAEGEGAPSDCPRQQPRPFLYMVSMPLADGIRAYAFPSMQPKLDILTTQQRDAVGTLIDAFDLDAQSPAAAAATMADSDDDTASAPGSLGSTTSAAAGGGVGGLLDCRSIFNPAIHLFYAATVQRALDGPTGTTLPALPPALADPLTPAAHVRNAATAAAAVAGLAELLPTRRVEKRRGRAEEVYFAANPDGSKRLLGAFLPDEFGDCDGDDPLAGLPAEANPPQGGAPAAAAAAAGAAPSSPANGLLAPAGSLPPSAAPHKDVQDTPAGGLPVSSATSHREPPPPVAAAPPPPVAPAAGMEAEASEVTAAAAPRGHHPFPIPATTAATTAAVPLAAKRTDPPQKTAADSDEEEGGGPGGGHPGDPWDLAAIRQQVEATQRVGDSQAESRLFSYATHTTGGGGTAVASTGGATADSAAPGGGTAAAAAPPRRPVWGLGADDPVGDFGAMLANGDADAAVAAEELGDCFRSRVRGGDVAGAAAALAALRAGAVAAGMGGAFNGAARKLLTAAHAASPFLARPAVAFLAHLAATPGGPGGGLSVLRLITEAEGGGATCAAVTPAVGEQFNRLVAAAAGRVVGAPPAPSPLA